MIVTTNYKIKKKREIKKHFVPYIGIRKTNKKSLYIFETN